MHPALTRLTLTRLTLTRRARTRRGAAALTAVALTIGGAAFATPAAAAAPARTAARTAAGAEAVTLASSFRGTPYVWGGATPRGFDCSGLVQYVYGKLGVPLPRTAQQQYDVSRHILASQLRPGDLIFWGGPRSINHVALYAGAGRVWNAPHRGATVRLQAMWGGSRRYGRVVTPAGPASLVPPGLTVAPPAVPGPQPPSGSYPAPEGPGPADPAPVGPPRAGPTPVEPGG